MSTNFYNAHLSARLGFNWCIWPCGRTQPAPTKSALQTLQVTVAIHMLYLRHPQHSLREGSFVEIYLRHLCCSLGDLSTEGASQASSPLIEEVWVVKGYLIHLFCSLRKSEWWRVISYIFAAPWGSLNDEVLSHASFLLLEGCDWWFISGILSTPWGSLADEGLSHASLLLSDIICRVHSNINDLLYYIVSQKSPHSLRDAWLVKTAEGVSQAENSNQHWSTQYHPCTYSVTCFVTHRSATLPVLISQFVTDLSISLGSLTLVALLVASVLAVSDGSLPNLAAAAGLRPGPAIHRVLLVLVMMIKVY